MTMSYRDWDRYPFPTYRTLFFWRAKDGENSTFAGIEIYFRPTNKLILEDAFTSKSAARKYLEKLTEDELEELL